MKWMFPLVLFATLLSPVITSAQTEEPVVVVELFTSQGCPSCPQADKILKKIAAYPYFLPLSYHVTYFDKRGWKDPFSTPANTARQQFYAKWLGLDSLFTPQMVINGVQSLVGSNADDVAQGLARARNSKDHFPISVVPNPAGDGLDVTIGDGSTPVPADTTLYEVHFNRSAITPIQAGDNEGLTVENVNNVVAFFPIQIVSHYFVPLGSVKEDGIAYLLQTSDGRILGAGYFLKK